MPKKLKEDSYRLDILADDKASFMGYDIDLCTEKFPDWRVVVPELTQGVTFDRVDFMNKVKEVLPSANKTSHQVSFSFNGDIELHAQDVDFAFESNARMNHRGNEVGDFKIAFNGTYLVEIMKALDGADKVKMLSDGRPTKGCFFTDGVDQVFQMPLLLVGEQLEEPAPKPAPADCDRIRILFIQYIDWAATNFRAVHIHIYEDKIRFRYLRMTSAGLETGNHELTFSKTILESLSYMANQYKDNFSNLYIHDHCFQTT